MTPEALARLCDYRIPLRTCVSLAGVIGGIRLWYRSHQVSRMARRFHARNQALKESES